MVRLPNDVVARLRARRFGEGSLYQQARAIIEAVATGSLIDCGFSDAEYTELELLARGIGFGDISEMIKHLSLAYLRLAKREIAPGSNDVVQAELSEMFGELYNTVGYESGISVTTTPRKIRGV